MYGTILYFTAFAWLDFLFVENSGYRKFSFWLFILLAVALWATRKKWMQKLRDGYVKAGILVPKRISSTLAGDVVWIVLELYFVIFLYLIPGFMSVSLLPETGGVLFVIITIGLIAVTVCDTQIDMVLTGEHAVPPLWVRMMPVSMISAAVALALVLISGSNVNETVISLCLQLFFVAELILNLGIRRALQKRRERLEGIPAPAPVRELKLTAWVILAVVFVEECALNPIFNMEGTAAGRYLFITGVIFVVQTACIILLFIKRKVWTSYIKKHVAAMDIEKMGTDTDADTVIEDVVFSFFLFCWILFGSILPSLLEPELTQIDIPCLLFPMVLLMMNCLNAPLYAILTGSENMPKARWRFPFVTLAVCTYAVCVLPMPWTDVVLPAALSALGLLELFLLLGICRMSVRIRKQAGGTKT